MLSGYIINNKIKMKKTCNKCTFRIYWNDDYVLYSCGHTIHTSCLFTNKYSIINPSCILCTNGNLLRHKCIKNEKILAKNIKIQELNQSNQNFNIDILEYEQSNKGLEKMYAIFKLGIIFIFVFIITIWIQM